MSVRIWGTLNYTVKVINADLFSLIPSPKIAEDRCGLYTMTFRSIIGSKFMFEAVGKISSEKFYHVQRMKPNRSTSRYAIVNKTLPPSVHLSQTPPQKNFIGFVMRSRVDLSASQIFRSGIIPEVICNVYKFYTPTFSLCTRNRDGTMQHILLNKRHNSFIH